MAQPLPPLLPLLPLLLAMSLPRPAGSFSACVDQCIATPAKLGHFECCSNPLLSSFEKPSCATGCRIAEYVHTLAECDAACDAAGVAKCSWDIPNGGGKVNMCGGCDCGLHDCPGHEPPEVLPLSSPPPRPGPTTTATTLLLPPGLPLSPAAALPAAGAVQGPRQWRPRGWRLRLDQPLPRLRGGLQARLPLPAVRWPLRLGVLRGAGRLGRALRGRRRGHGGEGGGEAVSP